MFEIFIWTGCLWMDGYIVCHIEQLFLILKTVSGYLMNWSIKGLSDFENARASSFHITWHSAGLYEMDTNNEEET